MDALAKLKLLGQAICFEPAEGIGIPQAPIRVNGELRQRARTSQMAFSPAEIIAYASSIMTLEQGDLFMTGAPAGIGPLVAGDVVEVEGIGVLRNPAKGQTHQ